MAQKLLKKIPLHIEVPTHLSILTPLSIPQALLSKQSKKPHLYKNSLNRLLELLPYIIAMKKRISYEKEMSSYLNSR